MTTRVNTIVLVAAFVLFAVCAVLAADAGREPLFSLGAGARPLGMGGGSTALPLDASAVYYNPAGLPRLDYHQFSFMHATLFEGTLYDVATWSYPLLGAGGFGAGFMRIGTNDIERRSNFVPQGTFNYAQWQFMLSYGRTIGSNISTGLSVKIANVSVAELSDYGLGLDLGIQGNLYRNLTFGLMVRDLVPTKIKLDTTSQAAPVSVVGGLGLKSLKISKETNLNAALDLEKFENRSVKLHAGAELGFYDRLALRAGYDRDNLSVGAGYRQGRITFDYAYKSVEFLEDSHRFSLTFSLGTSIPDQRQRRLTLEQQRGTMIIADERTRQFNFFKAKADSLYNQLRLDSALTYYQRALAFDESNSEILGTIAAIESVQRVQAEQEQKIRETQKEYQQYVKTYYDQASVLFSKKYYPAAGDLVSLILDIDSTNADALALRHSIDSARTSEIESRKRDGEAAERDGRIVDALDAYNRILELDPNAADIQQAKKRVLSSLDIARQLRRGIDFYNAGQYDEARRRLLSVLAVNPSEPVALEYLSKMATTAPSETTLEDIQKNRDIWQLYLEGLRHMRNKEYQQAIDAWQKVLEVYPSNKNTIDNINQARLRLKQ